jgi:copper transport protein
VRRLATIALLALAFPAAASAHAEIRTSYPLDQDVVRTAPARVAIRFNAPIETGLSRLQVLDARGARVDRGGTFDAGRDQLAVRLAVGLPRGTYTVAWRIVASDAHAQRGAFVFHVVRPSANPAGQLPRLLAPPPASALVRAAEALRLVVFALLLLAVGGVAGLLVVGRAPPRLDRTVAWIAVSLAAAVTARFVVETAASGGLSLGEAASRPILRIALASRFGEFSALEAVAALTLAVCAWRRWRLAAVLPALALVVAPPAMGHAEETGAASFLLDLLHVQAAAVWVGGLVFVLLALRASAGERWTLAARIVPRFSAVAVAQVPVLLAAGALNGYFQLRGWWALFHTTYGQLLIAKVAIVLPLLALGFVNRRTVPRLLAGAREQRRFLAATGAELALFVAVLGVTAFLVGELPGRIEAAQAAAARTRAAQPFVAALSTRTLIVQLTVTPARAGSNRAILYLDDRTARPAPGGSATLLLTPAGGGAAPVRLRATSLLPGQFAFDGIRTATTGTWLFTFVVRRPGGAVAVETFQVPIGR